MFSTTQKTISLKATVRKPEMHCYICDREDDLITFDHDTAQYGPCTVCKEVITECLESFDEPLDEVIDVGC